MASGSPGADADHVGPALGAPGADQDQGRADNVGVNTLTPRLRWPLLIAVLCLTVATGQTTLVAASTATPGQAARLQPQAGRPLTSADRRELHRRLQDLVAHGAVGVVAEVRSGQRVWRDAAGTTRRGTSPIARPGAHFRAASITKMGVAIAAVQLMERGTWSLDTTIADVRPGLWPGHGSVTVKQLLSHTSGMPDYVDRILAGAGPRQTVRIISRRHSDREKVDVARQAPWDFPPGSHWSYSNTGYVVVGMMLRAAYREPLARILHRHVYRPAGMTHTFLATHRGLPRGSLREYARMGGRWYGLPRFHPSMMSGSGAMLTTTADLNRLHRALAEGTLVSPQWLAVMRTPVMPQNPSSDRYGLGTLQMGDPCGPGHLIGHDGASYGTQSWSFSSPSGRREVTFAFTGMHYGKDDVTGRAYRFLGAAAAATCR